MTPFMGECPQGFCFWGSAMAAIAKDQPLVQHILLANENLQF
jgi:hypothetical protein